MNYRLAQLLLVFVCASIAATSGDTRVHNGITQPVPPLLRPFFPDGVFTPFFRSFVKNQQQGFPFPSGEECEEDAHKLCGGVLKTCVGAYDCSIQCLTDHAPALSESCRKAHPCYVDIDKFCANVQGGKNEMLTCLKKQQSALSEDCKRYHPCLSSSETDCKELDYSAPPASFVGDKIRPFLDFIKSGPHQAPGLFDSPSILRARADAARSGAHPPAHPVRRPHFDAAAREEREILASTHRFLREEQHSLERERVQLLRERQELEHERQKLLHAFSRYHNPHSASTEAAVSAGFSAEAAQANAANQYQTSVAVLLAVIGWCALLVRAQ